MSNFLFDDFTPSSPKAWKQKIQVDLQGADYNETLLWKTEENITVKPFYTKEDSTHQKINLPQNNFNICQSIFIDDEKIANKLAIDALKKGATAIEFVSEKKFNIEEALKNISFGNIYVYFNFLFLDSSFISAVSKHTNSATVFFNIDIIGNLAKTGNWFFNLKEDHNLLSQIVKNTNNSICINASAYQNAGANITQQLAYALSHANEYLNYFGENAANKMYFNFSVSGNYFFEIAKFRAFRILWKSLLKEYGVENNTAHIFSKPSLRNKTLYESKTNILRTSSECMSAILGGSNTVANISYDVLFRKSNKSSEQISLHQLLSLKEENGLQEAKNIVDGTYYIESITNQLAENALEIFKLIEKGGGFLKQLKEGIIQKKISESAVKEQTLFKNQELILIGVNKIYNKEERIKNELELFPFVKKRHQKTLIQPIIQKRLAEEVEQERLKNE